MTQYNLIYNELYIQKEFIPPIVGRYVCSTVHVPSDTLRTWNWSPTPKGTCPFTHLEDLEVVPHPPKYDPR